MEEVKVKSPQLALDKKVRMTSWNLSKQRHCTVVIKESMKNEGSHDP